MKKLGIGTMRLPLLNKNEPGKVDLEQFKQMVDLYIDNDFTYFDTAYVYHAGLSENAVKIGLVDRYPRESFQVATKLPASEIKSFEDRDRIFNNQLNNLGVSYIDYYLLHCILKSNYQSVFEKYDCFNWLFDLKEKGLIKKAGFSYHDTADLLDEILTKYPQFDFVQLQINYLDWESNDIQSRLCYEVAVKHNIDVIVMEPIKGGALANVDEEVEQLFKSYNSDMSIASWAVRFAASLDKVVTVLSGMSNLEQAKDNISYMNDFVPLTQKEIELCHHVADIINSKRAIQCTACAYCVKGCPMEIQIPDFFETYNRRMQAVSAGTLMRNKNAYLEMIEKSNGPATCIECGQCEKSCPQHLTIRQYLKEIVEEYGK